jgi:hypothetical protein
MNDSYVHNLVGVAANTLLMLAGVNGRLTRPQSISQEGEFSFGAASASGIAARNWIINAVSITEVSEWGAGIHIRSVNRLIAPQLPYSFGPGGVPQLNLENLLPALGAVVLLTFKTDKNGQLDDVSLVDGGTHGELLIIDGAVKRYRLPTANAARKILSFTGSRFGRDRDQCLVSSWDGNLPSDAVLLANNTIRVPSFREALPCEFVPKS